MFVFLQPLSSESSLKKVKGKLKKYVKYFCSLVKVYYFCNPFLNKERDKFFENIEISLKSSKYPSILLRVNRS